MEPKTLLLNSWGLPHAVLSWEDAVTLVYQEKVVVLEEYDQTVASPSVTYFIPAVLQLKHAVSGVKKGVKFSRINVFTRDGFKCQYCGTKQFMSKLNYDHVIPRKQGGKTVWENIVTACYPCNDRKGSKTVEQAGMKLRRKPAKPHSLPLHAVFLTGELPEAWLPFLQVDNYEKHPHGDGVYITTGHARLTA